MPSLPATQRWYRLTTYPPWHGRIKAVPHHGRGLIRYRTVLNAERLLVVSPAALTEVLTTKCYHFKKPRFVREQLRQVLGVGILLVEGDEHRAQRKTLQPAFAFRHVKDLYAVMWDVAREAASCMTGQTSSQGQAVVNIADWASRATLDIIGIAGMGHDFGATRDPRNRLHQTYKLILTSGRSAATFLAILRVFLPSWFVSAIPIKRNWEMAEAIRTIRATCRDLIRKKIATAEPGDKDILTVALSYGGFSEDELIDQLMTFLAAGHETTATALTWAIYALCVHPEMQYRLREEIRMVLPSPSQPPGPEAAASLPVLIDTRAPYLNAVCNEVLRYYPPVPTTIREAAVDTTVQDIHIPAGTKLVLAPRATNWDPSLWGCNAAVFDPERWLDKVQGSGRSNYALLTFLHGPRACIGQSFARAELAILLAALVGRFEFNLQDERLRDERNIELRAGATIRPAHGLMVTATFRDGW